jgi:glycosyltransferase involved in cell wall biosynthesis
MNALACGATVLGSSTAPIAEMIEDGKNGLLVDFFDVEGITAKASQVLDNPADYKPLGAAGAEMIKSRYSLAVCLPQMLNLYEHAAAAYRGR